MNKRLRGPILVLVLVIATTALASNEPADAWVPNPDGCKFSGTSPAISYKYIVTTSTYRSVVATADYMWDNTSAPGYFWQSFGTADIWVYDASYGSGKPYAWVGGACGSNDIWNLPLGMYYNRTKMDPLSSQKKWAIAVHEFGHTYGLWENPTSGCTSPAGLMYPFPPTKTDQCGWYSPQPDDVNGVHGVY